MSDMSIWKQEFLFLKLAGYLAVVVILLLVLSAVSSKAVIAELTSETDPLKRWQPEGACHGLMMPRGGFGTDSLIGNYWSVGGFAVAVTGGICCTGSVGGILTDKRAGRQIYHI